MKKKIKSMKQQVLIFVTLISFAFIPVSFVSPVFAAPPAAKTIKSWTFLIFMAADNNLEASAESDLNELETIGSTKDVNILVQLDRLGKSAFNDREKWSGSRRFLIQKDDKPKFVSSPVVQNIGAVDMATPEALLSFIRWAKTNYPAKRYALILWNHGTGWKEIQPEFGAALLPAPEKLPGVSGEISYNISYDDTSGTSMDIPTLGETLKKAAGILGKKIDLIGFDACLMQMAEVAYEIAPAGLYQVAAPDREPDRGWPYDVIAKYLTANPSTDGKGLGEKIVNSYKASYEMGSQGNTAVILSLINLGKTSDFIERTQGFLKAVKENIAEIDKIEKARHSSVKYVYEDYVDLANFLKHLIALKPGTTLKKAAEEILEVFSGAPEDNFITINAVTGEKFKDCGGLAIFFPDRAGFRTYQKRYKLLGMSSTGGWYDFLDEFESPSLSYLKINEAILEDKNGDGRIGPGETVKVQLLLKNFGKLKAQSAEITCKGPSDKVTFKNSKIKIDQLPLPGKELTIQGPEFEVKADAPLNSEVALDFTLTGEKIPDSTFRTVFYVKAGFVSSGKVLLVFADGFSPAAPVLQGVFTANNVKFDVWDRMLDGNLKTEVLKRYLDGWVFVAVQDSSKQQVLLPEEVGALSGFLKTGGRLVLSGQDLAFSLRDDPFLKDLCKVSFIQDDTNVLVVSGTNEFMKGSSIQIYGGDGANNQKWPDEIDPLSGAKTILKYDAGSRDIIPDKGLNGPDFKPGSKSRGIKSSGGAAVEVVDGYRLAFFAFGIESIGTADLRNKIFKEMLSFVNPTVENQIRDYGTASRRPRRRPNSRQNADSEMEKIDMLSSLQERIIRQVKEKMRSDPYFGDKAMATIRNLPEDQKESIKDLEKDIHSLLEFNRQHGTLNAE